MSEPYDPSQFFPIFDYNITPWLDRPVSYGEKDGRIYLFATPDKKGEKPEEPFAVGGILKESGKFCLMAVNGQEDRLEWYRRKVRKWMDSHGNQKPWYDWFGAHTQPGNRFIWSPECPNPDLIETPVFID